MKYGVQEFRSAESGEPIANMVNEWLYGLQETVRIVSIQYQVTYIDPYTVKYAFVTYYIGEKYPQEETQ